MKKEGFGSIRSKISLELAVVVGDDDGRGDCEDDDDEDQQLRP
jgi:hypothetical protein